MFAVSKRDKKIVDALIAAKANLNFKAKNNTTALMTAVMLGHKEVVEALIAVADTNIKNTLGETALMLAVNKGHKDIAKLLIGKSSDPEITLLRVSGKNDNEIVKMLMKSYTEKDPDLEDLDW